MEGTRESGVGRGLRVEEAGLEAWKRLAGFHYRGQSAGAADKVFALERAGARRLGEPEGPVGVIVYAMPVGNCALRNLATGGRYLGLGEPAMTMRAMNAELRCISRVVIHPSYRGIGLGSRLVRETLGRAGTAMVEAMAVMGQVNPFFERAGMRRYEGPLGAGAVRVIGALEEAGVGTEEREEAGRLARAVEALEKGRREFVMREMRRFAERFGRTGRQAARQGSVEELAGVVWWRMRSRAVYYLWSRGEKILNSNI